MYKIKQRTFEEYVRVFSNIKRKQQKENTKQQLPYNMYRYKQLIINTTTKHNLLLLSLNAYPHSIR